MRSDLQVSFARFTTIVQFKTKASSTGAQRFMLSFFQDLSTADTILMSDRHGRTVQACPTRPQFPRMIAPRIRSGTSSSDPSPATKTEHCRTSPSSWHTRARGRDWQIHREHGHTSPDKNGFRIARRTCQAPAGHAMVRDSQQGDCGVAIRSSKRSQAPSGHAVISDRVGGDCWELVLHWIVSHNPNDRASSGSYAIARYSVLCGCERRAHRTNSSPHPLIGTWTNA
jgi:hypothetical protein